MTTQERMETKQKEYQRLYQKLQQLEAEANAVNQEMFKIVGAIEELNYLQQQNLAIENEK